MRKYPSCRLYLCVFSLLFVSLLMRASEGTAPCIIFREKRGPTGRTSRNRKHCKLKGKGPVRGFGKYQHSVWLHEKHFQRGNARQANEPVYRFCSPIFQSAQSCGPFKLLYRHWVHVVCDDARWHVVVILETINLLINVSPTQDVCAWVHAAFDGVRDLK